MAQTQKARGNKAGTKSTSKSQKKDKHAGFDTMQKSRLGGRSGNTLPNLPNPAGNGAGHTGRIDSTPGAEQP